MNSNLPSVTLEKSSGFTLLGEPTNDIDSELDNRIAIFYIKRLYDALISLILNREWAVSNSHSIIGNTGGVDFQNRVHHLLQSKLNTITTIDHCIKFIDQLDYFFFNFKTDQNEILVSIKLLPNRMESNGFGIRDFEIICRRLYDSIVFATNDALGTILEYSDQDYQKISPKLEDLISSIYTLGAKLIDQINNTRLIPLKIESTNQDEIAFIEILIERVEKLNDSLKTKYLNQLDAFPYSISNEITIVPIPSLLKELGLVPEEVAQKLNLQEYFKKKNRSRYFDEHSDYMMGEPLCFNGQKVISHDETNEIIEAIFLDNEIKNNNVRLKAYSYCNQGRNNYNQLLHDLNSLLTSKELSPIHVDIASLAKTKDCKDIHLFIAKCIINKLTNALD